MRFFLGNKSRGEWANGVLDNRPVEELEPKTSFSMPPSGKIRVEDWLLSKGVRPWERGGMRAFAVKRGMAVATDAEFEKLFLSY